jgi:hypothetical protein
VEPAGAGFEGSRVGSRKRVLRFWVLKAKVQTPEKAANAGPVRAVAQSGNLAELRRPSPSSTGRTGGDRRARPVIPRAGGGG